MERSESLAIFPEKKHKVGAKECGFWRHYF
jgi:hypothetical protein